MKRFIRCGILLLIVSMFLITSAYAAETVDPRASNYFAAHGAYIEVISDTKFEVWFDVTAVKGMDVLGASEIKVQRSSDRTNWTTMKTYTKENYPQMVDEDTGYHEACVTYTYTQGYYYRAKITFYAKNSSGTAEYTMYTSSINP